MQRFIEGSDGFNKSRLQGRQKGLPRGGPDESKSQITNTPNYFVLKIRFHQTTKQKDNSKKCSVALCPPKQVTKTYDFTKQKCKNKRQLEKLFSSVLHFLNKTPQTNTTILKSFVFCFLSLCENAVLLTNKLKACHCIACH